MPAPPPLSTSSPTARSGLARKHALVWSMLVGFLLAASGLIAATFAYRDRVQGVEAVQREKALAAAERIRNFVDTIEQPLRWVVADPMRSSEMPLDGLHIELLQLLRRLPALSELRWIDAAGRERLALSRLAMDVVESRRDWSADPRVRIARRDGELVGRVEFLRDSEPHLPLTLASRSPGPVLFASINLKSVWDITRQVQHGVTGIAYVVDGQGQLLSHPELSLVLRRTDMSTLPHVRVALRARQAVMTVPDARDLSDVPVLATAAPIPRLGWTVLVEQERSEALAPLWASVARSVALSVLGVLVAILASSLLARRLVKPIRALQARAADIAAGHLEQRIEILSGDELQSLAEQFNRMAADLQSQYASLEARVAERTLALAEANQAKSRFLAAASHDLRQPVHALGLFVGQLRQARDAAAQQHLVGHIERSVASFESLLESLLDISRLDAGVVQTRREPVALGPLIDRLSTGFAPTAAAKGLELRTRPTPLWAVSDPVLLERILINLLVNAIRYTMQGGVLVGCRKRGDRVEILVVDTGIGIEPEHLPRIFQEFYRGPAHSAAGDVGLGLGLAIVRRLAVLLGHDLSLRSVPGHGSAFRLALPLAEAQRSPEATPHVDEPLAGRRVLVIDDDHAVLEAMRGQLAQWGCAVSVAHDSAQALSQLHASAPELVVTDLRLGDHEDGLVLARQLAAAGPPGLKIAVLTGESDAVLLQAVRNAGLPLLSKPLRPARLRALMESLLSRAG